MNILAECLKHADTTRAPQANEKARAITKAATELYDLLRPLSGQIAVYQGHEVRVNVARGTDSVTVALYARVPVDTSNRRYGDGRKIEGVVLLRDSSQVVATGEALHDGSQYVWREFSGLSRGAADLERLGALVAATVGPLLKIEV